MPVASGRRRGWADPTYAGRGRRCVTRGGHRREATRHARRLGTAALQGRAPSPGRMMPVLLANDACPFLRGGAGRGCPRPGSRRTTTSEGRMPRATSASSERRARCHPRASGDGAGQPRPTVDAAEGGSRRVPPRGAAPHARRGGDSRPPGTLAPGESGVTPGGAAHAPGAGVCRRAKAGCRERSRRRASGWQDAIRERPATGLGSPDPRRRLPKVRHAGWPPA